MTATIATSTTAACGIHSLPNEPLTRFMSHVAEPPPGVGSTSNAQPAHTKDIARVTTMSGTRVRTIRLPLTAPSATPRRSTPRTTATPNSSDWPFMRTAATTLISAIIEPIERSIPPAMTTMAWATAASARGRTEIARPWMPVTPYLGWISLVYTRRRARNPTSPRVQALRRAASPSRSAGPARRASTGAVAALISGSPARRGLGPSDRPIPRPIPRPILPPALRPRPQPRSPRASGHRSEGCTRPGAATARPRPPR